MKALSNSTFITSGLLAPFLSNQVGVYKSPADIMPSANGQRIRSYSMNGQMGCFYLYGVVNFDAPAKQYVKENDLILGRPSQLFVFCEECPYTINDGYLVVSSTPLAPGFHDVPAAYLENGNGACAPSFADGHAEVHRWMRLERRKMPAAASVCLLPAPGSNCKTTHLGSYENAELYI